MILAQKFKTLEGAHKRAAFENSHKTRGNVNMVYRVVRFQDGRRVDTRSVAFDRKAIKDGRVHWQIEKIRKEMM